MPEQENSLMMTSQMYAELDKFMSEKTIIDVDRNTFLVCNLFDKRIGITISLVFMKDWDSIEPDSYNMVAIEDKGAVLIFPCYWVSIPKELCKSYFEFVINDLYKETISEWKVASELTSTNEGNNSNNGCGCNPIPIQPPMQSTKYPCGEHYI